MLGKHKFHVGQRVKLSEYGRSGFLRLRHKWDNGGTVTKVDEYNSPTVLWDDRKTAGSYHPDFIEPDYRRQKR